MAWTYTEWVGVAAAAIFVDYGLDLLPPPSWLSSLQWFPHITHSFSHTSNYSKKLRVNYSSSLYLRMYAKCFHILSSSQKLCEMSILFLFYKNGEEVQVAWLLQHRKACDRFSTQILWPPSCSQGVEGMNNLPWSINQQYSCVGHTCNPSTHEAEAGEVVQVQGRLGYRVRPYLKHINKRNNTYDIISLLVITSDSFF